MTILCLYHNLLSLFVNVAPDPIVSLTVLSNYFPLHVGHNLTLQCEMTVPSSAGIPLSVLVMWKWKGAELLQGDRLELIPVQRVSNQSYVSEIIFTEVTTDQIGLYECNFTIEKDSNSEQSVTVLSASSTATTELAIKGTLRVGLYCECLLRK